MAAHSAVLAWRTPWTEEPGRPWFTGSQRVGHDSASGLAALSSAPSLSLKPALVWKLPG